MMLAAALITFHFFLLTASAENYPYRSDYLWLAVPDHADATRMGRTEHHRTGRQSGGALSLITAALDKRADGLRGQSSRTERRGRLSGWPHMNRQHNMLTPQKVQTLQYYDVVNFARRIECPVYLTWGFNDNVCPPTTSYIVWNLITAPKESLITPINEHWTTSGTNQLQIDDLAATEYLAQMPEVDELRIGCAGWSMGGYRAWMLAALSDRIKAGASVCWKVTADEQMSFKYDRTENGGFANCFPGLRRWLDYPHVASMACPKAMLFINGSQDKLFPVAGVEKAFKTMHDTWESQGAGDKIQTELWDMPHSCGQNSQQCILEFFKKHL